MLRVLIVFLLGALVALGCHGSKKSKTASSKPKPKPKTSAPAKKPSTTTSTTKPAPAPKKTETQLPKPAETSDVAGVAFTESEQLSPVLELAQKNKKVVFLEFTASWCAPCKVMEEEVLSQKPTYTYLNKNFINYKVDFDSPNGQRIASIYEVKSLPTVLFLDPKGVVLEKIVGMATHTSLTTKGDSALKKLK